MESFFPYFIVSLLTAITWTGLVLVFDRKKRQIVGLLGAWATTLIIGALWQTEALPWLGNFIQLIVLLWLGGIGLVIIASVSDLVAKNPGRVALVCCSVISLMMNLAAGLHFLWIATVGAGGV